MGVFQGRLTGTSIHVNQAAAHLSGYDSVEEAMALPTSSLCADKADRDRLLHRLRSHGSVENLQMQTLRKDGSRIWTSMNAVLLRGRQGGPDTILGVVNDITAVKEVEHALRVAKNTAEEATRAKLHEMFAREAGRKGVRLFTVVSPGVPVTVTGDLGRLRQVLVNLVGNAVNFTEGGEIELGCACTEVPKGDVTLHFRVRDTGIGISRDKQEMIFDIFARPMPPSPGSTGERAWG